MSSTVIAIVILSAPFGGSTSTGVDELRWQRSKSSVALVRGEDVVWQFNYGPELNVPYFHPVATADGLTLTWNQPPDHAWHHGLWFSWKYINKVNYWEHVGRTGKPAGTTAWSEVKLETNDDGSAVIRLTLRYHPVESRTAVLVEHRRIDVSAPNTEGLYTMDWTCVFTTLDADVTLDRTPPREESWGGYAGLSIRFAQGLTDRQTHDTEGVVEFQRGNRHRERALAMDYSGLIDNSPAGVAFLDHPTNVRHPTRWYAIRDPVMSYINAALLNDGPLVLKPRQTMKLRYRLIIHPDRWGPDRLHTAFEQFKSTKGE